MNHELLVQRVTFLLETEHPDLARPTINREAFLRLGILAAWLVPTPTAIVCKLVKAGVIHLV